MHPQRDVYGETGDGVRLGGGAARWERHADHVHLTPHHTTGRLARVDAELLPFVADVDACAPAFLAGVNTDQCVSTTMEEAFFLDYAAVLLEAATVTSSPAYCKDAVVFNAKQCCGFVTATDRFAEPGPWPATAG